MDLKPIGIEFLIVSFSALLLSLPWAIGHSVYLNRIGSRGMASVKRLVKKSTLIFLISFVAVAVARNNKMLFTFVGANLGGVQSAFDLGVGYYHGGFLVQQDFSKAKYWYQKAADAGLVEAQYALASMYHYGEGTHRDDQEALRLASSAATRGNCYAMILVGELLATSPKTEDQAKATASFRQALPILEKRAASLDASACVALSTLYSSGHGVKQDLVESLKWMIIADRIGLNPLQHLAFEQIKKNAGPSVLAEASKKATAVLSGTTKLP